MSGSYRRGCAVQAWSAFLYFILLTSSFMICPAHGSTFLHVAARHCGACLHSPGRDYGANVSLADFAGKQALLVMFICKHCPYVVHVQRNWHGWDAILRTPR